MVQVPNETLMKSDIDNITESDALMDRIHFEVDARGVTPAMVKELGHQVHDMMHDSSVAHLYDRHYHPHASIRAIGNPLKFQVRLCSSDLVLLLWPGTIRPRLPGPRQPADTPRRG